MWFAGRGDMQHLFNILRRNLHLDFDGIGDRFRWPVGTGDSQCERPRPVIGFWLGAICNLCSRDIRPRPSRQPTAAVSASGFAGDTAVKHEPAHVGSAARCRIATQSGVVVPIPGCFGRSTSGAAVSASGPESTYRNVIVLQSKSVMGMDDRVF